MTFVNELENNYSPPRNGTYSSSLQRGYGLQALIQHHIKFPAVGFSQRVAIAPQLE
jgi:hypothetical protein